MKLIFLGTSSSLAVYSLYISAFLAAGQDVPSQSFAPFPVPENSSSVASPGTGTDVASSTSVSWTLTETLQTTTSNTATLVNSPATNTTNPSSDSLTDTISSTTLTSIPANITSLSESTSSSSTDTS